MTRLLLVLLLLAGCAAPRPGPETSPLASSFGPQGRTGAPTAWVAQRPSTETSEDAGSNPVPGTHGVVGAPLPSSPLPAVAAVGEPAQRTANPSAANYASEERRLGRDLVSRRSVKAATGSPTLSGVIAHMGTAPVGPRYAAIPWGPGIRVRICAARCVTVVSADTGPSLAMQRAGRVADVSVELFVAICGRPASAGLCQGSVETR